MLQKDFCNTIRQKLPFPRNPFLAAEIAAMESGVWSDTLPWHGVARSGRNQRLGAVSGLIRVELCDRRGNSDRRRSCSRREIMQNRTVQPQLRPTMALSGFP